MKYLVNREACVFLFSTCDTPGVSHVEGGIIPRETLVNI